MEGVVGSACARRAGQERHGGELAWNIVAGWKGSRMVVLVMGSPLTATWQTAQARSPPTRPGIGRASTVDLHPELWPGLEAAQ
jgi:hypothetical protein